MAGGQVVVPLRPGSDGDPTHRPSENSTFTIVDPPSLYLEKIGQQWMRDRGEALPGVKYVLEALPAGYALYQRPRTDGTNDKYLYGNPGRKYFDSPNRFYAHFKHLMEKGGDRMGCPCTVCHPRSGVLPGRPGSTSGYFSNEGSSRSNSRRGSGASSRKASSSSSKKPTVAPQPHPINGGPKVPYKSMGRPKTVLAGMDSTRLDEEGTPDVYRNLIDRLKRNTTLDEAIKEPLSLDWRAEQEIIPDLLKKLQRDPQWIPRVGDIILYIRNVAEGLEIAQHPRTGIYQLYDAQNDEWLTTPVWEAGLVGQAPADAPNDTRKDEWYVSHAGVRVEPLPDPNDGNKSFSKRYTYVPVEHTRPFLLWEEYIGSTPREQRHPTIQNAFTASATMSLMGKYRFRGSWPNAQIWCHAIYIGAELIVVGDTVRLMPKAGDHDDSCRDVLVVKSIRLRLSNLDQASENDYDEGRPYNSEVWIFGSAFTTVASRSSKEWLSENNTQVPKSAFGYGDWYPLHPSNKELAVPFSRIMGRLYEHDAMELWDSDPHLDCGREGLLDARNYASKNDKRIVANFGTSWFWAESRADALDLQTVNGLDVGRHDNERDPKEWRKKIKIMEAAADATDRKHVPVPGNRSLRRFMAPAAASLPLRPQESRSEGSSTGSSVTIGSKRRNVIDVSEDDEEDIRRQTRIVTDLPFKKTKVMVVVD